MDKLTRYNQKLLAILGTMAIIALAAILIISLAVWIFSISDDFGGVDNTLQVPDSLVQKDGKIHQLVSFSEPELVDTLNNIYIIPVSQRTLEQPIEENTMRLNKIGSTSSYESIYNKESSYNNIIVYHKNNEQKTTLFDFRVNITHYYDRIIKDKIFLFIIGSKGDTNKDGSYSNDDLENLYLYDLENDFLKTIDLDNASYEGSTIMFDTDELVIEFGMDINKDGEYDSSREPSHLIHYTISKDEQTDFVPDEMQKQIQSIVD